MGVFVPDLPVGDGPNEGEYLLLGNTVGIFYEICTGIVIPLREIQRGYLGNKWYPYSRSCENLCDLLVFPAIVSGAYETLSIPVYWAGKGIRGLTQHK
ncbi:MAG: hypothetical protein V1802_03075 [Candidatus Aenigmatarchaeota archaeon]